MGFDLVERRIPNGLVLCGLFGSIGFNAWRGFGEVFESLLGFGLGIALFFVPFVLGWMGAGDVKMLGTVGAILGIKFVPRVFFYTALSGLVLGLVAVAYKRGGLNRFKPLWRDLRVFIISRGMVTPATVGERVAQGQPAVPYGVAIATGTLITYYLDPRGEWAGF
jgi:prepilin peptidase CpaA